MKFQYILYYDINGGSHQSKSMWAPDDTCMLTLCLAVSMYVAQQKDSVLCTGDVH